ncbi:hypothetical protein RhiirA5_476215 [Rhizophagus irregularis]|uniref:Uncharacterized protein n=1 Tax=Rhizophagus irregularis TaxID=588596 RepID=A0A2I1EYE0_9GLOM|nr:hypothetical protein RhiirA5_476215 [Rhizophagus irregularis]PKY27135.1 hypothetical protein RhiirB3_477788 [Rhizophagus irregularis]CAB4482574.1 unnamed protein product [Rhizophagus irregularis]CAB5216722.1 unnamed protein product [Rhizophagus irregularis]CAB5358037.1 unnamed protein product [Rhizophagus irregularis]
MDYSNLSIGQTGNNFINNSNDIAPASQNNTFEFYLPLPNDTHIYHVIYTELNSTEIARLLNNRIDLSHIPNHRLPYHYNVQHIIRQQITIPQQSFDTMDVQPIYQGYSACDVSLILPIQQPVDYQQDTIPQQSFDTMDIQRNFQEYSDDNTNDVSSILPIPVDYKQDTISQQSSDNIKFEFYLPLPNDAHVYHVTYTELNLTEIAQLLNNRIDLSHIPDHRLPYNYKVQHLICQQIVQQPVDYQHDAIPQQSFQEYSDNSAYDISPFQQPINYQQDTIPQQSFDTVDIQPTIQDNNTNDASSVPNSPEDGYNSITSK